MRALFFSLCLLFLFVGCEPHSIPKAIQGSYWPGSSVYAGYSIKLGDGVFTYKFFTDFLDDPKLKDIPQQGKFTLNGSQLTLRFSNGQVSHLILTKNNGKFIIWSLEEYKEYLRTRFVPDSVLCQQTNS
jgi:hypothetical protein